jgi:NAD(P)-dependent dehydrogenase (short-subunit alcohol dehydrogenase family)
MGRLEGQVALVTGGAQGIGGATARRLAEEGARVLIGDVDAAAADVNLARIRAAGGTAEAVTTDVASHDQVKAAVDRALQRWGKLTIVINNAYRQVEGSRGSALDVTEEGFDQGVLLLVKPIYLTARYAVPAMEAAGGGAIVNISSVHGLLTAPGRLVYETGKAAVIGATRQMACDFGPVGIRVNAICPGHIVTERMQARQWADNPGGLRFFEQQYPVRRTGTPVDIANAIVFLCSDEASFITGQTLAVDGGLSIQLQEDLSVATAHWIRQHPDLKLPYEVTPVRSRSAV